MKNLLTLLFFLASGYRLALPGYQFEFPADHGSHPEFKLEWWYWTGHLQTEEGREFGYELTFFRSGLDNAYENPSSWKADDLYPAHFAVSDLGNGKFHFFERLSRPGPGMAAAARDTLELRNRNWTARLTDGAIRLRAAEEGLEVDLTLVPEKPPVIHGSDGVSQKGEGLGRASHYYSMTRLRTSGWLVQEGVRSPVSGLSWMDHEFGTNQLSPQQVGWDWLSLQLDNGEDLMIYGIRLREGGIDPSSSGTVVAADGDSTHLKREDFQLQPGRLWLSPDTQGRYPVQWTVRIPSLEAELEVEARFDGQELTTDRSTLIAYWEGAVSVGGKWKGKPVRGQGYLEMTGYARDSTPKI